MSLTATKAQEEIQRLLQQRGLDAISFTSHAREKARERHFSLRDVEHVLRTGDLMWDERSGHFKVGGKGLDGDDLTVVVVLDPKWARITIITGF